MKKSERKISKANLVEKIGKENLRLIEGNVFCHRCGNTTIVDYDDHITVNDLNDTILQGKCKKCGHSVARYLETGET